MSAQNVELLLPNPVETTEAWRRTFSRRIEPFADKGGHVDDEEVVEGVVLALPAEDIQFVADQPDAKVFAPWNLVASDILARPS